MSGSSALGRLERGVAPLGVVLIHLVVAGVAVARHEAADGGVLVVGGFLVVAVAVVGVVGVFVIVLVCVVW